MYDCINPNLYVSEKYRTLLENFNKTLKLEYNNNDFDNDEDNNQCLLTSFDTYSSPILIDTGASFSYNFDKSDFIDYRTFDGTVSGLGDLKS